MKSILCLLILVFVCSVVCAVEGVNPGSYEVDFESGLEKEFIFDFVLDGKEELKIRGDLAGYVELDKDEIVGREDVVARLKLPEVLDNFGVNNIWIIAGDVAAIIKVWVPYPDRYVDLSLAVPDVNIGEEVLINLKVSNFGKEALNVSPIVKIYNLIADCRSVLSEPDVVNSSIVDCQEFIEVFEGEERKLDSLESFDYEFSFDSSNYSSGDYLAVVGVDEFNMDDVFRLGERGIKILNYTREVRGGGLRRFEIEVESIFDDRMKEVYAEVRIIGRKSGGEVSLDRVGGFDSSIVSLGGWERKVLVGYFDARELEGEVMLSIDVYYDGEVESEVVRVNVMKGFGLWVWAIGFFVLGLLGFFGWKFFWKRK